MAKGDLTMKYVRELTDPELVTLECAYKNHAVARVRIRAHIITQLATYRNWGGGPNPLIYNFFAIYCSVIMKQYIEIRCRYCGADDLVRNGRSENGTQRYRCNECGKSFQNEYSYNAWKPGVKERIETRTLNSSGIGDIGRNLGISKNTVISELKKKLPPK
ncbi:MAG: IS1 family transposase [Candidatus Electrothrix sp. LOE2]|nr:IS1 family transposase [Candidatus Electrothrix sp. LOE2]